MNLLLNQLINRSILQSNNISFIFLNKFSALSDLVGGDVVVELEGLLVALDGHGVLLAAVPPVGYPHAGLAHLSSLDATKKN